MSQNIAPDFAHPTNHHLCACVACTPCRLHARLPERVKIAAYFAAVAFQQMAAGAIQVMHLTP
jgi:hypothetical protein